MMCRAAAVSLVCFFWGNIPPRAAARVSKSIYRKKRAVASPFSTLD
jgi:hypothetical protein